MATFAWAVLGGLVALLVAGVAYQHVGARHDARRWPPPGRLIALASDGRADAAPAAIAGLDTGSGRDGVPRGRSRRLHLHALGDETTLGERAVSVVFESGLAASSLNWRPVQEAVAGFARAYAYDRAGYGWSDRASGLRSARASAADLHALLRAAGVPTPYVLVGHSFGTYIAPVFAAAYPEDVAGLVLVDPITPDDWLTPDRAQRRMLIGGYGFSCIGAALASVGVVRFLLNRARSSNAAHALHASHVPSPSPSASSTSLPGVVLRLFGREADTVVRRVIGEVTKMPPALWPMVQAHWSRSAAFLTMAQHFRALSSSAAEARDAIAGTPDVACRLRDLPLVVISASTAPESRVEAHSRLATISSRGDHLRATTGGHWVHLDEPSLVVNVVRGLVDGVMASRAERQSTHS